jgi:hypothetical protein
MSFSQIQVGGLNVSVAGSIVLYDRGLNKPRSWLYNFSLSLLQIVHCLWADYIRYIVACDENTIASLILFVLLVSCTGANPYGNPEVDPLKYRKISWIWWTYPVQ